MVCGSQAQAFNRSIALYLQKEVSRGLYIRITQRAVQVCSNTEQGHACWDQHQNSPDASRERACSACVSPPGLGSLGGRACFTRCCILSPRLGVPKALRVLKESGEIETGERQEPTQTLISQCLPLLSLPGSNHFPGSSKGGAGPRLSTLVPGQSSGEGKACC